ncbi:hypothetical protein [Flavobacterium sp. 5]|uniref:hypothetical protein n=1 Tax=Flavobacterium sp. 5 TaxID=2035199 RepID=UPI000CC041E4|nr:hypothetical protein [Flavobacterium sp. 5]PKB18583.1 hypothetical protein CLU82_3863 [Flavobacterium sp. 5]
MKNSVLILGIALVSFSNICNAKSTVSLSNNLIQNFIFSDDNAETKINEVTKIVKPSMFENVDVFNPETVIAYSPKTAKEIIAEGDKIIDNKTTDDVEFMEYEESMREIVAQSDLVTENVISNETHPLYIERTIEDEITELELIIESANDNDLRPLDFKKINCNSLMNNSLNSKKFIGMN